jgi:GNAT superfamily N-acetyltransferase
MRAGNISVEVAVDPVLRRKGIGSRLFAQARAYALAHQATRLEAEVQDRDPTWLRFARLRGFQVDRHAIESRLELAQFNQQAFSGVVDAVTQSGIRFFTLGEAGNTEANQRTLYEMSKRNSFDIPGHEGVFPTFDVYRTAAFQASFFRPEGLFIAAVEDRWIGQTSISYYEATNSTYTQHTGVDREYRGRNIALALKLLGIAWGRRIGAAYTRTHNDESNLPILTINRRLGFKPIGGYYRILCDLSAQGTDGTMRAHR